MSSRHLRLHHLFRIKKKKGEEKKKKKKKMKKRFLKGMRKKKEMGQVRQARLRQAVVPNAM